MVIFIGLMWLIKIIPWLQLGPWYPGKHPRHWPVCMSQHLSWQLGGHCNVQVSPTNPFYLQPTVIDVKIKIWITIWIAWIEAGTCN